MAIYKEVSYISQLANPIFDEEHAPGAPAPREGIYRCVGCGREVTAAEDMPLPAPEHHAHGATESGLMWKLIVFADHRPKQG